MSGTSRLPDEQIARDHEARAWELRCKCWSQARIAAEIGVTQQAVSKMLQRTRAAYLETIKDRVAQYHADQQAQLEHVVVEASEAWERSKADAVKITESVHPPIDGQGSGFVESEIKTAGQCGDPKYLEVIRGALADMRKLWGLDAPVKIAGTTADGGDLPTGKPNAITSAIFARRGIALVPADPAGAGGGHAGGDGASATD